jgi:integrase
VTRHGAVVWYVRAGKGRRTRIRAQFGTPQFDAEYQAALAGNLRSAKRGPTSGTLAWLIERYRETTAWADLSLATRRNRENHFKKVIETAGHQPIGAITQAVVSAGRDRRASTPAQARNFLDAMRGLFRWAKEAKHVTGDPTEAVKYPKRKKGPRFPVWTEADAAAYDKRWPIGTKERVWRDVLFYTGLRRGDAVRLGRQHVRNGIATLRTEKSQVRSRSHCRSCRSCNAHSTPVQPANSRSSVARTAIRSPRTPSATSSRKPARPPDCSTARRTAAARSPPRAPPRAVRRSRN